LFLSVKFQAGLCVDVCSYMCVCMYVYIYVSVCLCATRAGDTRVCWCVTHGKCNIVCMYVCVIQGECNTFVCVCV